MLIEKIGEGKTIAEAFENAKALLGAPEDAEIGHETISDAKRKMFGLITENAKVRVWYEVPDAVTEEEKKEAAPVKEAAKPVQQKKEAKPAQAQKPEAKPEEKKAQPEAKPETAPVFKELPVTDDDIVANYIKGIVENIGVGQYTLTLTLNEEEKEYVYTVNSEDDGALIGKKGETLDAIQYLVRLFVNKGLTEDKHRKVTVNAGNYREKRRETLIALARKNARQVRKYGRPVTLEPMNPYERRIIHTAIQAVEGVTSESTGFDDNRRVVISLEEGVEATNPGGGRGGYGNRGGRRGDNHGRRGGRGGYQKREPYQPSTTRAPRKDSAGSLYGRIEIPSNNED